MDTYQHLIANFLAPNAHFHFARTWIPENPHTRTHSHDFYELFLVEDAPISHWVNGEILELQPGTVVFMRPTDVHTLSSLPGQPARVSNVLFRTETATHLATRYGAELGPRFFWSEDALPAAYLLSGAKLDLAKDQTLALQTARRNLSRLEEYLLTIMGRCIDLPETARADLPTWLVVACEQARQPEIFRLGAAGFVQAAGRGHEHVCRKTKEHLGVTPSTFINRIRMEHAAQLLAGEEMSVNDVADECGIENMSHFYRVFRQHFGMTPKAYRKQHQLSPF